MSDLDNLLDTTLDDLADLPSFAPYPVGAHRCLATLEAKEIAGKPAVEMSFKYQEALELANEQDIAPNEGDTANVAFFLDNEYGQGNLKKATTPIKEALGCTSLRELVDQTKDVEVVIITSLQANKKNPDSPYMQVKELQVV